MKKTVYFILLSAATFLISCASNTTGIDAYTETLYKPSYASGFEIVGAEGRQSTLLKVFNPWQGAENTETTLFIVRNGEKIPAGFTGQVVKAGARRIVCLSSTYVAMLDALGQVDRVVGVSGRNYISNKYVTTHEPVPERYDALRAKVAAATSKHPKVMINTPYAGSWFMASTESYVARLIADAGGDYIYKKNTSNRSLPIDLEEAYMLTAQADMWLNAGSAASLGELKSQFPKFANTRCVRNGAVYNCNKRLNAAGGNDYWESGVVRPDVVLHDLIAIMHPEALDENDRELHYYQRLE